MPDISKWKTQSLKELFGLFSDCSNLLFLPDISKWNNYNKKYANEKPDYKRINSLLNFTKVLINCNRYNEINKINNNFEFIKEQVLENFKRFYD